MATILRLGPANHGQPLSYEEYRTAEYRDGFKYELIDGRLYVAAAANLRHNWVEEWVSDTIKGYARAHPEIINYVSRGSAVFVPDRPGLTAPQPDIAAYNDFPTDAMDTEYRWEDVSPILVVEVVSPDDPDKDLVRNVELYRQVPSIKEYWIFDNRVDGNRPTLRVYRRTGRRWRILDLAFGDTYTTRLLPGFTLHIDARR